jgi:hypothetical protein
VEEGDVITNDDPYNQDRFLIENGQKRFFTWKQWIIKKIKCRKY